MGCQGYFLNITPLVPRYNIRTWPDYPKFYDLSLQWTVNCLLGNKTPYVILALWAVKDIFSILPLWYLGTILGHGQITLNSMTYPCNGLSIVCWVLNHTDAHYYTYTI